MNPELEAELAHLRQRVAQLEARDRELEHAQQTLKLQARLLDALEEAVIVTDLSGTISYWNQFAEALYGWPAAEVLGKHIVDVLSAPTAQALAEEIISYVAAGQRWAGEFLIQRRDGTIMPVYVTNIPLYDDAGALSGIINISVDSTASRRADYIRRER